MLIATCPACGDSISIPTPLVGSRHVRCPYCGEQYPLAEILDRLPKSVISLDESDQPSEDPDLRDFAINETLTSGSSSNLPDFDFSDTSERAVHATVSSTKPLSSYRPGNRRNAVSEILKIVAGGIAGLILAQLILWWLPGGYRRDPFRLAPRLPRPIAFLAPTDLRGVSGVADAPDASSADQRSSRGNSNGNGDGNSTSSEPGRSNRPIDDGNPLAADVIGSDVPDNAVQDVNDDDSVEQLLRVRQAPSYSSAELDHAISASREGLDQWRGAGTLDVQTRTEIARQFYTSLGILADRVTFPAVARDSERIDSVDALLSGASSDPATRQLIASAASRWLETSNRPSDGVLILGHVMEIHETGLFFVTTIESVDASFTLDVVSKHEPSSDARMGYARGDTVLVLGSIVDNPTLNIIGFTGSQERVIWSNYALDLAAEF